MFIIFLKSCVDIQATSQRVTFAGMRHKASPKNKEAINGDENKQQDSDYSWVDKLGFWPRKIWYHCILCIHSCPFFCSGFGLAILAGLLYGFCFTFIQLMELCTDHEHQRIKGRLLSFLPSN